MILGRHLPPQLPFKSKSGPPTPIKMDPDLLPRPTAVRISERTICTSSFKEEVGSFSPPGRNPFQFPESEISSTRFARPSSLHIPACPSLQLAAAVPLACILQPFAESGDGADSVPLARKRFGEELFRCTGCKAFANPHFYWFEQGRKVRCNLCDGVSEVRAEYYCTDTSTGSRSDKLSRSELRFGSYDLIAPSESNSTPPVTLFVIDASYYSIDSTFFRTAILAIRDSLDNLPLETEIGIVLYDDTISFFRFDSSKSGQPSLVVVGDIEDPFIPGHSSSFLVSPHLMKEQLCDLLDSLCVSQSLKAADANRVDVCSSAALYAGVEIVSEKGGGSVALFQSGRSGIGTNKGLSVDDTVRRCMESNVCVDLFVDGAEVGFARNLDFAASIVTRLGGETHEGLDGLASYLERSKMFNCVMKVRASRGLLVDSIDAGVRSDTTVVPRLSSKSALSVSFSISETLDPNSPAFLQFACLYTRSDGTRLIRIHNVALHVTNQISAVFKHSDSEAIATHLARTAVHACIERFSPGNSFISPKEATTQALVAMLYSYRVHCAMSTSSGQLILPDSLKTLPLMLLGFLKTKGVRTNPQIETFQNPALPSVVSGDARTLGLHRTRHQNVQECVFEFVPKIFTIFPLNQGKLVPASRSKLLVNRIYLFDRLDQILIEVGREVSPEAVEAVLGLDAAGLLVNRNRPKHFELGEFPKHTQEGIFLHALINDLNQNKRKTVRVLMASEAKLSDLLIEDRIGAECSYMDWLCLVHKLIQDKID